LLLVSALCASVSAGVVLYQGSSGVPLNASKALDFGTVVWDLPKQSSQKLLFKLFNNASTALTFA